MGITINGLETRFLKPKGGENPFKSAKPFDDIVDYNSLEDGDLFYIELKEGWTEVKYGDYYSCTTPNNVIQSLPEYINKSDLSYNVYSNVDSAVNVDEFFQFDFTPYIKLWIEKPSVLKPTHVSIGAFILPKYLSPYNMDDIPLYLDTDQFKKFKDKLPTVNLGLAHVLYDSDGHVQLLINDGNLYGCIIGNKILVPSSDCKAFTLKNILEDLQLPIRSMVPIHFLREDNSYDYFSVGNSITIYNYIAEQYENDPEYFWIESSFGIVDSQNYVDSMINLFTNIFDNDNRTLHISSIIDETLYYLKNDVQYYQYIRPEKIYIIYNNGVFSSLDEQRYNIINTKTYLNIIEYFENNPESNMTFTTSELIKLFNIKPVAGLGLVASSMNSYAYGVYTSFNPSFYIQYIDGDHVKILLAGGYSNSSSSQELLIGEFEE